MAPVTSPAPLSSPAATASTAGNRAIKITGISTAPATPPLVPVLVLGTPTISLSPASGPAGTAVTVNGTNFNVSTPASAANTVYGTTSAVGGAGATDDTTDGAVQFGTDANGAFSVSLTINDLLPRASLPRRGSRS